MTVEELYNTLQYLMDSGKRKMEIRIIVETMYPVEYRIGGAAEIERMFYFVPGPKIGFLNSQAAGIYKSKFH